MELFTHASQQRMKSEAPLAGKVELCDVIDAALERRKLYAKKGSFCEGCSSNT
jgi:hypothetical protein